MGVDKLDSILGLYRIHIRSKKWHLKFFFHLLDLSVVNAWLLWRRANPTLYMPLSDFKAEVAECLCKAGKQTEKKGETKWHRQAVWREKEAWTSRTTSHLRCPPRPDRPLPAMAQSTSAVQAPDLYLPYFCCMWRGVVEFPCASTKKEIVLRTSTWTNCVKWTNKLHKDLFFVPEGKILAYYVCNLHKVMFLVVFFMPKGKTRV